MPVPVITALYAGLFGIFYALLTVNVGRVRTRTRILLGDGGDERLQCAIRAHGNFAEQVPFILLIVALLEMLQGSSYLIHGMLIALIVARLSHAAAILIGVKAPLHGPLRLVGALTTFLVLIISSGALVMRAA